MMKLSKAKPESVFEFLKELGALQPCTLEQIRSSLKAQIQVVRSARTFAFEYQLAGVNGEVIHLLPLGARLVRYTGQKRVEFTVRHWRLQDMDPFRYIGERLSSTQTTVSSTDVADLVRAKFSPQERWDATERRAFGDAFVAWLEYMHLAKREGDKVTFVGGEVATPSVLSLLEVEFLKERELRDWFAQRFDSVNAISVEPLSFLGKIPLESEDKVRSELFERFVLSTCERLGFSSRSRNPYFNERSGLTFDDNKGGGDIVLFYHHPLETRLRTFHGAAIACEAKSTEGNVGSKAVGQARNLVTRVQGIFPEYYVVPLVVSRSKVGYDPSGRDQAPPDVVHITDQSFIRVLNVQKRQVSSAGRLLLPSHILQVLDGLVKDEHLEPTPSDLEGRMQGVLLNP